MIYHKSHSTGDIKSVYNKEYMNLGLWYQNNMYLFDLIDVPKIFEVMLNNYFKVADRGKVKEVVDMFNKQLEIFKNEEKRR